jgi:hypothetical protein
MKLVDTMPKDLKMKGLETLRQVTEGKLFLEVKNEKTSPNNNGRWNTQEQQKATAKCK